VGRALEFFFVNLYYGVLSSHADRGGVAFFAHVGGFVAGLVLVRFFMAGRTKLLADRWSGWRPPSGARAETTTRPNYR